MGKKYFIFIFYLAILSTISMIAYLIAQPLYVSSKTFYLFYNNMKPGGKYLPQAYLYESMSQLISSCAMLLFLVIIAIGTAITKFNSLKLNLILIFIELSVSAILLHINLNFSDGLSLHSLVNILDFLLPFLIYCLHVFASSHNDNKLIAMRI
jgi:hypothetical protein